LSGLKEPFREIVGDTGRELLDPPPTDATCPGARTLTATTPQFGRHSDRPGDREHAVVHSGSIKRGSGTRTAAIGDPPRLYKGQLAGQQRHPFNRATSSRIAGRGHLGTPGEARRYRPEPVRKSSGRCEAQWQCLVRRIACPARPSTLVGMRASAQNHSADSTMGECAI
jgi:hypothetical protein